jgi:hypothetical protein
MAEPVRESALFVLQGGISGLLEKGVTALHRTATGWTLWRPWHVFSPVPVGELYWTLGR